MIQRCLKLPLLFVMALAPLGGCAFSDKNDLFESNGPSEVGATHFAITSVTRWADIQDDLQPTFEMTEAQALQEVIPVAEYSARTDINDSRLAVTGQATVGSIPTSQNQPGTENDQPLDRPGPGGFALAEAGGRVGIEPQLRYSLATALLQYVRMTNRFVRDLVDEEGADVYVVRIQVSLMPLSREAQYDTYTDIGFFGEDSTGQAAKVRIIPLLATDSLEGLMQSNSSSNTRDIALSLQAMIANGAGGGGIDAEKLSQTLKAVSGEDVNSLLTMGRVTDNTVRVRLGAFAQPSGEFVMVPRTVAVPVVMLVPRQSPAATRPSANPLIIHAVSKTVFVNAVTGKLLRGRTHWRSLIELPPIRDSFRILQPPYGDRMHELYTAASNGDFVAFSKIVQDADKEKLDFTRTGELWLEAQVLRATDAYQSMSFTLPHLQEPKLPPGDQTATLYDDGHTTSIVLRSGSALHQLELRGVLEIASNPGNAAQSRMRLYASMEPTISANGRDIMFSFPSLIAAGINPPIGQVDPEKASLCVTSSGEPPVTHYSLVRLEAPRIAPSTQPTPGPIIVEDPDIAADPGGGALVKIDTFAGSSEPWVLSVEGAEIAAVASADPPDLLVQNGAHWEIRRSGSIVLRLAKCDPNKAIDFAVVNSAGKRLFSVRRSVHLQLPGGP